MLILRRSPGESIHFDGPAEITVLKATPKCVAIGIVAPATTHVVRSELEPLAREPKPQEATDADCVGH